MYVYIHVILKEGYILKYLKYKRVQNKHEDKQAMFIHCYDTRYKTEWSTKHTHNHPLSIAVAIFELGRMKRNRPTSPEIKVLAADMPGKLHRRSSDGSFNDLQQPAKKNRS